MPARLWLGLALGVVPGLLLLGLQVYVASVKAPALLHARQMVAHTFEVILTAEGLRGALKDAERAQRGFLITTERSYLEPYRSGAAEAPRLLARLAELTADNPEQQRRLPVLGQQVEFKLHEMQSTLAAYEADGLKAARDVVANNSGMEAMRTINALVDAVVAAERELLARRTQAEEDEGRAIARAAAGAGALAVLLMVLGGGVVVKAVRDMVRAQAAQRDSERRLAEQRQEVAQYQKMEALGQLTGGVAHDFNNLLHVIKNGIDIALRQLTQGDAGVRRYLEMANRSVDRAASVTQRLLAFSRRQVLDPRPVDPNRLLAEVTALCGRALGEGIAIETVEGAGAWWTLADEHQLETALLNLALNARDAMAAGGKLTLEVANAYLDDTYAAAHAEVKAGQYVMIAVSDTGSGMSAGVAAQAFEPFFTTKGPGRGTGLGLAQVYGFVKQSNGHITIYSEPGQGTTVKIYLPRFYEVPDAPAPTSAPAPAAGAAQGTILVVEDERDILAFTTEALTRRGYRVLAAEDGAAALRILEREPVDLLFTDVGLPNGMNGRQLADEALRRRPGLKVLFTTAYTRNAIVHHGRLDPGVELVPKPYTETSLADKVGRILD